MKKLWVFLLIAGMIGLYINQIILERKTKANVSRIEEHRKMTLEEFRRTIQYIKNCDSVINFHEKDINILKWKIMDKSLIEDEIIQHQTNFTASIQRYIQTVEGIPVDTPRGFTGTYLGVKFVNGVIVEEEK